MLLLTQLYSWCLFTVKPCSGATLLMGPLHRVSLWVKLLGSVNGRQAGVPISWRRQLSQPAVLPARWGLSEECQAEMF